LIILYLGIITTVFIFEFYLKFINYRFIKTGSSKVQESFQGELSEEEIEKSRKYTSEKNRLDLFSETVNFIFMLFLILIGFRVIEFISKGFSDNYILNGLLFFALFGFLSYFISLPFTLYSSFNIEERYGFNKKTPKLFLADTAKSFILTILLGGLLLSGVLYLVYDVENWWIYFIFGIVALQFIIQIIYPKFIMPLFNKFSPIEDQELLDKIKMLSEKSGYNVKKIFVMDASKRSKHSNAFITGLGKNKRIVLFDTLLEEMTNDEIVAVFAHEIGHFKKKHFLKNFFISLSFMVCFVLLIYYFIQSSFLYNTFDISEKYTVLVYSVILISSLFSFMNFLLSYLSRKFEFEADKYAVEVSDKKAFIDALKKLGKQNLSVLEPHPLYKKFYYSHPTISEREKEINNNDQIKK